MYISVDAIDETESASFDSLVKGWLGIGSFDSLVKSWLGTAGSVSNVYNKS